MANGEESVHLRAPDSGDLELGTPFIIIRHFLESSTSDSVVIDATSAATQLTGQLTIENCSLETKNPLHPANYVYRIFSDIIEIATQIPHNHVWHPRLASLLRALAGQPPPPPTVSQTICSAWGMVEFRWEKFPTFATQQGELFGYKSRFEWVRQGDEFFNDMWSPDEWLNINKFISLLVAEDLVGAGESGLGFDDSGLSVLRHTLEIPRSDQALEDNIPAAAVWVLTAGKWIQRHDGLSLITPARPLEKDIEEYIGPDGFNEERWELWEYKFGKFAGDPALTEETRVWARAAADYMATQDMLEPIVRKE